MKIELKKISIRELVAGYEDEGENAEEAVVGFGGLLNIRPAYQRAFVYDATKRNKVIESVQKGFPLNVMYWAITDSKGQTLEVLDGQQRAISICQYYRGDFAVGWGGALQVFSGLTKDQKDKFLDYELRNL